jgi:hypothetical protein
MAYSSGGLIEASDYNNFLNGSNQLNTVWSTGNGDVGYGQNALTTVSDGSVVTATQWATFINALNAVRNHQSGAGTGAITAPVAGDRIDFISTLSTSINTAYTNRALFAAQGTTVTGSTFTTGVNYGNPLATTTGGTFYADRRVTFASANAARYFFNAGGRLNFVIGASGGTGSASNNSLINMINAVGGVGFLNNSNTGRFGSGLTLTSNNTGIGSRQITSSAPLYIQVNDTAGAYTSNLVGLSMYTDSTDTTNGSNGNTVIFRLWMVIVDKTWDDSINCTVNTRVDIVPPSSTYLTDTWGTPTIS